MRKFTVPMLVVVVIATISMAFAQQAHDRNLPPNVPPNPHWTITKWGDLPAGMDWSTLKEVHSVGYDPNGKGSILVLVTGPNPSDPPVWVFGLDGKFQKAWGANLFGGPHSVNVDRFGYIWITDNVDNIVRKFTEDGKLLMTLGKRGVAGDNASQDSFDGPSDVVVAPNGDFFITDGYRNSRIVKFDKNGKFLMIIGGTKGNAIGQFNLPHKIVLDSKGELVVADRVNQRIQFWTQDGKFIKQWTDLGLIFPSGLWIMPDDTLYISDTDGRSVKIVKDDKIIDQFGGFDGSRPHQITMDKNGAFYISDGPGKLVKKITRNSATPS
jgi:peptidylamidoglycolate lyase